MASYRKRNKKWEYRIYQGKDKKPITKGGFKTKSEAQAEAEDIEYQLRRGYHISAGDQLFIDYYKKWAHAYKIGVFSKRNDRFYYQAFDLIEEYFAGKKLKEITRGDYQYFLNEYSKGLAKATVDKMHHKIAPALKDAHAQGYIPIDPTYKAVIRGKNEASPESKYINEEQSKRLVQSLLDSIQFDYTSRYMLLLQLATGARIGEIMALQFQDIDFLRGRININKNWDYQAEHDFVPTKNEIARNISVDKKTLDLLLPFYEHQRSAKIQDAKQRLFAQYGEVVSINAVNKTLKNACERANIPVITTHGLRHTHASLLIYKEVDISYISKRLGHKDIYTTLKTYAYVIKEAEEIHEKRSADAFYNIY